MSYDRPSSLPRERLQAAVSFLPELRRKSLCLEKTKVVRIHRLEYQRAESYRVGDRERERMLWRYAEGTLKSLAEYWSAHVWGKTLRQREEVSRSRAIPRLTQSQG